MRSFYGKREKIVDNGVKSLYNGHINREDRMTNNQFELLIMHGGMMHEGMSSNEAIAAILLMKEPAEDVAWLIKHIGSK